MGWRRRGSMVGVVVGGLLGGALLPAAAPAARYHVYGCHTPAGEVAPIDGWEGSTAGPYTYAANDCSGRTSVLSAALDGQTGHAANASAAIWAFTAAPNLGLVGATLYRREQVLGGTGWNTSYATYFATPNLAYDAADAVDACQASAGCTSRGANAAGFDPVNRVVVSGNHLAGSNHLFMEAFCGGADGQACPSAPGYAAEIDLYSADLTLEDGQGPVVAGVGGALVGGGPLTGAADVWFRAYDQGSGVYAGAISLDGQPVSAQVIDENGGRCRTLGQASDGLRDFRYQTPCKAAVSADLSLDTSLIRDGRHALQVTVDDAAGNVTGVYSGTINTRNAPQNGVPQAVGVLAQGQRLTARPGSWSPSPTAFTFQWLRCEEAGPPTCQPIPGALEQTYLLTAGDDYQHMAVDVTAIDAAGSTTTRSAPIGPVADLNGVTTGGAVEAQSGGLTGAKRPRGGAPAAGGGAPGGHVANGTGACPAAHLTAAFATGRVGHAGLRRVATLRGRLDCAGHPVAGARIEAAIARRGDRRAPVTAELPTARDGSFALALAPGPSREVRLTYRAFADEAAPSATASARLVVTPSIGFSIRPVRVHNRQTITYRGRVFGGYIPASGLPLEVQYRDGARWRTFDQTRARARDGRFLYHYTFRRTTVSIVYTFRVAIPPGGATGYPYGSGASRPRSVRVDP